MLNGTQWVYVFLCFCACVYRGPLLCRARHHDNQVRWWVFVPDGGFWTHSCLPLLLDNRLNTEAFITGHHRPQLCRICLYTLLPRMHFPGDCHQMPGNCLHLYVKIISTTIFIIKVTLLLCKDMKESSKSQKF